MSGEDVGMGNVAKLGGDLVLWMGSRASFGVAAGNIGTMGLKKKKLVLVADAREISRLLYGTRSKDLETRLQKLVR